MAKVIYWDNNWLGVSLRMIEEYTFAIELFDKLLEIDPQYELALFEKGNFIDLFNN